METVNVIEIKNPFDPSFNRDIREVAWHDGKTLGEYLQDLYPLAPPDIDVVASVNGMVVDLDNRALLKYKRVDPGDSIAFCLTPRGGGGGGKSPLKAIAMVAVMVVASYAAPYLVSGLYYGTGFSAKAALVASSIAPAGVMGIAKGAVMLAGGALVNAVLPSSTPNFDSGYSGPSAFEESPSYSIEGGSNQQRAGKALPVVYGTVRTKPYLIGNYVTTDNKANTQKLNALFALSDCKIDNVYGVELNNTPITSFSETSIATTKGEYDQVALEGFRDTFYEQPLGGVTLSAEDREVIAVRKGFSDNDWIEGETEGKTTSIAFKLQFTDTIYHHKGDQLTQETPALFKVECQKIPEEGDESTYEWVEVSSPDFRKDARWRNRVADWNYAMKRYERSYTCTIHSLDSSRYKWRIKKIDCPRGTQLKSVQLGPENPFTAFTVGDQITKLGVLLRFDRGLYHVKKNGELENYTVKVRTECAKADKDGNIIGEWFGVEDNITNKISDPVNYYVDLGEVEPGRYAVRSLFTQKPNNDSRHGSRCKIVTLREGIDEGFRHPGTALLALYAMASEQISGMPTVTAMVERRFVDVWNPYTKVYEKRPANNPAWQSYDILHNEEYGAGVNKELMRYHEFESWATYCTEYGLESNIVYDAHTSIKSALDQIGQIGRGQVLQRGTSFGCMFDAPSDPAHVFNVGNIIADTLSIEYLDKKSRANAVEVTFFDKSKNYKQNSVTVYSEDFKGNEDELKKNSIKLYGCTSKEVAKKHAEFLLKCNKAILRTIKFDAYADAIPVTIGDVFYFQNDVTQWGYGGRVYDYYESTEGPVVVFDKDAPVEEGWNVLFRHNASYEETPEGCKDKITGVESPARVLKPVNYPYFSVLHMGDNTLSAETGDSLELPYGIDESVSAALLENVPDTPPERLDLYSCGPANKESKLFRVAAIERSQDLTCTITGVEYHDEVYSGEPLPTYESESLLEPVTDLEAHEVFGIDGAGTGSSYVSLLWGGNAIGWDVFYREVENDGSWVKYANSSVSSCMVRGLSPGTYEFSVAQSSRGAESGEKVSLVVTCLPRKPLEIETVEITTSGSSIHASWASNNEPYVVGYNVYVNGVLEGRSVSSTTYSYAPGKIPTGDYLIEVTAVDSYGQESERTSVEVEVTPPPKPLGGRSEVIDNNVLLYWEQPVIGATFDIAEYAIYRDGHKVGTKRGTFTSVFEQNAGQYDYEVRSVDTQGHESLPERVTALVSQPPDYKLNKLWNSDFSESLLTNAHVTAQGSVIAPVNTANSWAQHFEEMGTTTLQEAAESIDAASPEAAPYCVSPTPLEAFVESQEFDYGTVLSTSSVSLLPTESARHGSPVVKKTLAAKESDTEDYPAYDENSGGVWSKKGFRYLKAGFRVTSGGNSYVSLEKFQLKLDSKLIRDSGKASIPEADKDVGIYVPFNKSFADIQSLNANVWNGSAGDTVLIDFADVPNPEGFTAYIYDTNGIPKSGSLSWSAEGFDG